MGGKDAMCYLLVHIDLPWPINKLQLSVEQSAKAILKA